MTSLSMRWCGQARWQTLASAPSVVLADPSVGQLGQVRLWSMRGALIERRIEGCLERRHDAVEMVACCVGFA